MKKHILLVAILMFPLLCLSQSKFNCDGTLYYSQITKDRTKTKLFSIDLQGNKVNYDLIATYSGKMNAIAYNPFNNLIYGFTEEENKSRLLVELRPNGQYLTIGEIEGLPSNPSIKYYAATFYSQNSIIIIGFKSGQPHNQAKFIAEVSLKIPENPTLVKNIAVNGSYNFGDIAYDPYSNNLYAFDCVSQKVVKINPETAQITPVGTKHPNLQNFGALFFNSEHKLYGQSNKNLLFEININDGTVRKVGPSVSVALAARDGCSCSNPCETDNTNILKKQIGEQQDEQLNKWLVKRNAETTQQHLTRIKNVDEGKQKIDAEVINEFAERYILWDCRTYTERGNGIEVNIKNVEPFVVNFDDSARKKQFINNFYNLDFQNYILKNALSLNGKFEVECIEIIDRINNQIYNYGCESAEKKVYVKNKKIKISYWDDNIEDGDISTLKLNGIVLLEKVKVTKKKKEIEIELDSNKNIFELFAENEGSSPPNTAAISIDDGVRKQLIILQAKKGKSKKLEIIMN